MADNIAGRDGNGNPYVVAARDDGVAMHQRVQPTVLGTDVSIVDPLPVAGPVLEDLQQDLNRIATALALAPDPTTGRLRVLMDSVGTSQNIGTVTTVSTTNDLTRLQNFGQNSGPIPMWAAQMPAFVQSQEAALLLRQLIAVT